MTATGDAAVGGERVVEEWDNETAWPTRECQKWMWPMSIVITHQVGNITPFCENVACQSVASVIHVWLGPALFIRTHYQMIPLRANLLTLGTLPDLTLPCRVDIISCNPSALNEEPRLRYNTHPSAFRIMVTNHDHGHGDAFAQKYHIISRNERHPCWSKSSVMELTNTSDLKHGRITCESSACERATSRRSS